MLIGRTFEEAPEMSATITCAHHLADTVRNLWLHNRDLGKASFEEDFSENPELIHLLRAEGFTNLDSIDYIFGWKGDDDLDGVAGEITVIWKVQDDSADSGIRFYKTWLRVAIRDFVLGAVSTEEAKREQFRREFVKAFEGWKENFPGKEVH